MFPVAVHQPVPEPKSHEVWYKSLDPWGSLYMSKSATVPQAVMTDEGNGMRAALIVTALILVLAIPFAIGMIQGRSSGFTQGIVEMLGQ